MIKCVQYKAEGSEWLKKEKEKKSYFVVAAWTLAEPCYLAASSKDSLKWGIRVWIWEADIKQTARHDILFSWAMLTQIELHLLFSYASKVAFGI